MDICKNIFLDDDASFTRRQQPLSYVRRHSDSSGQPRLEPSTIAIHSGHFMVSCLDDDDENDDLSESGEVEKGYDFKQAAQEPSTTYTFGEKNCNTVEIDTSLSKLFQRMSLAYSGKLSSPKWKNFRGLRLSVKDKVRLNNIIWREWHLQYIEGRKPSHRFCQFEAPVPDKTHTKPEAIVLEGKYWKRKLESVCAEYRRWRRFLCRKPIQNPSDNGLSMEMDSDCLEELLASNHIFRFFGNMPDAIQRNLSPCSSLLPFLTEDDYSMDFTDNLFNALSNPFVFPNPRELSQLGNADIIQPGLVQLQPSLEDYMSDDLLPLPSLQEMRSSSKMIFSTTPSFSQFESIRMADTTFAGNVNPSLTRDSKKKPSKVIKKVSFSGVSEATPTIACDESQASILQTELKKALSDVDTVMMQKLAEHQHQVTVKQEGPPVTLQGLLEGLHEPTDGLSKKRRRAQSGPPAQVVHIETPRRSTITGSDIAFDPRRKKSLEAQPRCAFAAPPALSMDDASTKIHSSFLAQLLGSKQDTMTFNRTSSHTSSPASSDSENRSRHTSGNAEADGTTLTFYPPAAVEPDLTSLQMPKDDATAERRLARRTVLDPATYKEIRRTSHISAEQKRRYSIRHGFDMLCSLVPNLNHNASIKIAKASVLHKAAEHCLALKRDRQKLQDEMVTLQRQIEEMTAAISACQAQLPDTGAPTVTRQRNEHLKEAFKSYIQDRTVANWKFWIFSLLMGSLFESFSSSVATTSVKELQHSTIRWIEQHCSLQTLRTLSCKCMMDINNCTNMVRDPSRLQQYAAQAVAQMKHR